MGSAASFQQDSQQQPPVADGYAVDAVPVSVKTNVIRLHDTLKRLVEQALTPGETQKFFKSCNSTSQISQWLESVLPEIEPPHNDSVDHELLKQTTHSLTIRALKGVLDASHADDVKDHSKYVSELPKQLQEFEPITIDEEIKPSIQQLGKVIQRKLHRQKCDVEELESIRSNINKKCETVQNLMRIKPVKDG